jgi:uncharacterized protein HemX
MSGSVVWATVVGLVLGCVIGVAGMGVFLLPIQFKLQQEKLAGQQAQQEAEEQQIQDAKVLENALNRQRKAEAQVQQLAKEKKQLELRYAAAILERDEALHKLQTKP